MSVGMSIRVRLFTSLWSRPSFFKDAFFAIFCTPRSISTILPQDHIVPHTFRTLLCLD